MIRIADPAKIGPALRDIRTLLGYNRRDLARAIAATTGRVEAGIYRQIQEWECLMHSPTTRALAPVLTELGYDLALVPAIDPDEPPPAHRPTGTGWPGDHPDRLAGVGRDTPGGAETISGRIRAAMSATPCPEGRTEPHECSADLDYCDRCCGYRPIPHSCELVHVFGDDA
jgi:hypothetical protein